LEPKTGAQEQNHPGDGDEGPSGLEPIGSRSLRGCDIGCTRNGERLPFLLATQKSLTLRCQRARFSRLHQAVDEATFDAA